MLLAINVFTVEDKFGKNAVRDKYLIGLKKKKTSSKISQETFKFHL